MRYMVQVRLADRFEDIYVTADSPEQAVAKARKLTTIKSRWARFVV